ncbi:DUF2236 domain-containing protein [Leifsonia shinshuensis]|uniref:oxygenase MpaB family protein n=1 Tax=Leifsonia shinshuensis TaxID=150026 RepID=UPI001F511CFC|nr:oxygenase MpaB family protein [Leifsonia shinshuensis]MCI0159171.1 DUF2236 domain-containing protein [Leifsonia shinshuensis]
MTAPHREQSADFHQIAGEALCLAGGGSALLLQIAHPAVGRGVVEHSDFANRLMDRFHATMMFVYAAAFASPDEFSTVLRSVNRAHAPVRAPASGERPAYNAFDTDLQRWVSATLFATMTDLHERVFGPQTGDSKEQVYQDFIHLGRNLQLVAEDWPTTRSGFQTYWDDMVAGLRVSDETRVVARQILYPREVPLWLRAALPGARLVTAGLLPARVREQFDLPWNPAIERRFERRMRTFAAIYPRLPSALRHRPRDVYLRRLRRTIHADSTAS